MKLINLFLALIASSVLAYSLPAYATPIKIELTVPEISTTQYQRPFVAIWLEKKGEKRAVTDFAVWFDDKKWLKDIRRWWRKSGRYNQQVDSFTGATKPPGSYSLSYTLSDKHLKTGGLFTLYIEAVREHGNRTLLKQPLDLSKPLPQTFELKAGKEIGPVKIHIGE